MKFIYGKQDFKAVERGREHSYLLTNGLGGFSASSITGSNTRNDHALFMACIKSPCHRYNMVNRLAEQLLIQEKTISLSSQEYINSTKNEDGYRYLSSFSFEDYPRWVYQADGVEIIKEVTMKQGANLVAVRYEINNRTKENISLKVLPHLQFVKKGETLKSNQKFTFNNKSISSGKHTVFFYTNGAVQETAYIFVDGMYYADDACDGRLPYGNAVINHYIIKEVPKKECAILEIIYSMEETSISASQVFEETTAYRNELVRISGKKHQLARVLVKSANQFLSVRESTKGMTVLAGFPFFGDWGRDTMIAIAGCCICTKQYEAAKSVFRTFAMYCKDGLMPNLFPEEDNKPQYNTVDASLLFFYALYLYYNETGDIELVKEMYHVMEEIIECYKKGTAYGIHMDKDCLICAGEEFDQVTWMDVRIGTILPTPRHGKPVEVNAYWYNALCIMDIFRKLLNKQGDYNTLAKKVKKSFREKFWNEEKGCLKDVISGTYADTQIRCNQIWAVSMPFSLLDEEKERQVIDTVFAKLYTPYGLRTLEKSDKQFCGTYSGEQIKRDLAYHQGTVWVFPLGAYYLAYLKNRKYSKEAINKVESDLEMLDSAIRYGCIGQLPEIYDGDNPSVSKGCFAQAWSVGEILRVYHVLEEKQERNN